MLHYSVLFSLVAVLAGISAWLPAWGTTTQPALAAALGPTGVVCMLFAGLAVATAAAALLNRH